MSLDHLHIVIYLTMGKTACACLPNSITIKNIILMAPWLPLMYANNTRLYRTYAAPHILSHQHHLSLRCIVCAVCAMWIRACWYIISVVSSMYAVPNEHSVEPYQHSYTLYCKVGTCPLSHPPPPSSTTTSGKVM